MGDWVYYPTLMKLKDIAERDIDKLREDYAKALEQETPQAQLPKRIF